MSNLVSILIPAFNAEKYIRETIESAISQTWEKNEIIIVNDGSTDNTLRIANTYQSKSVKVLSQENMGASAARNKALEFAQGDYIQWLDADDLLAPDKIKQQMLTLDIFVNRKIVASSPFGIFIYKTGRAKFIRTSLWQDLTPIEWLLNKFNKNIWMIPSTWLVSREITEIAGRWDERLSLDDDGEYFCRVVAASEKIKFVEEAKSFYRIGNIKSLSNSKSDRDFESSLLSIKLYINCIKKLEDSDRTRDACLQLLRWQISNCYVENERYFQEICAMAEKLGGILEPKESMKFFLIKKILGWERAVQLKNILWNAEVKCKKYSDMMLYILIDRCKKYLSTCRSK